MPPRNAKTTISPLSHPAATMVPDAVTEHVSVLGFPSMGTVTSCAEINETMERRLYERAIQSQQHRRARNTNNIAGLGITCSHGAVGCAEHHRKFRHGLTACCKIIPILARNKTVSSHISVDMKVVLLAAGLTTRLEQELAEASLRFGIKAFNTAPEQL